MSTATPGQVLSVPLVSVQGFKAHPTYLDLQNLRSLDSSAPDQDMELNNILMQASDWAQNTYCVMPLQGHLRTDNARLFPNNRGQMFLYPDHKPVRRLLNYQYQASLGSTPTVATNPTCWIEDGRQIVVELGSPGFATWGPGPLQFGAPPAGRDLYTQYTYVAGYCNTLLAVTSTAGASTITVSDPTGLEPGDVFRIWDPGKEEACVVAGTYVPAPSWPPTQTAIPLVSPLQFGHTASNLPTSSVSVSNLPTDAYLGILYLGIDILQRYGSSDPKWPGMAVPSATKPRETPSSTWLARACELLRPFADTR